MKNQLIVLTIFSMLVACNREPKYSMLSSELKGAFGFNVGSYWIYRNHTNNTEDSFVVAEVINDFQIEGDAEVRYEVQYVQIEVYHSGEDTPTTKVHGMPKYFMKRNEVDERAYPFLSVDGGKVLREVTVEGKTYSQVLALFESGSIDTTYLAAGIGYLKMDAFVSDTPGPAGYPFFPKGWFSLLRHKVVL